MVPNKSRKRKSKSATAISTSANANPSNGEGLHYSLTVLLDAATRIESLEGKTSDEQPEDENAVVDVCSDVMPPAAAAAVMPSASAPVKEPAPKRRKRKPKKPKDEVAQSPSATPQPPPVETEAASLVPSPTESIAVAPPIVYATSLAPQVVYSTLVPTNATGSTSPSPPPAQTHAPLAQTHTAPAAPLNQMNHASYVATPFVQPQFAYSSPYPYGAPPIVMAPPYYPGTGTLATMGVPTHMAPVNVTPVDRPVFPDSTMAQSILFSGQRPATNSSSHSDMDQALDSITETDEDGDTCLHIAVVHRNYSITRECLAVLASTQTNIDPRNKLFQTPLHIAVVVGDDAIVRCLVLAGADVNMQDRNGRTPAHLCCIHRNWDCLRQLGTVQDDSTVKMFNMKRHKLDLAIRDYEGYTPIHVAVINKDGKSVNIMLEQGAEVDEKDGTAGRTALHHAVELQHLPITRYLIDASANVNAVNYAGNTPLHTAAGLGKKEFVIALMAGGADPTLANGEGDTAKDICRDKEIKKLMSR